MKPLDVAATRVVNALAAWHLVAFAWIVAHVFEHGYLPPQFFQFPDDTFADFIHTTYWAYHDERYSEWLAVHPPLVFAIGQLISLKECFLFEGLISREGCGITSLWLLIIPALGAAYLNACLFSERILIRLACFAIIVTSFPFLHAVERGNYVLFSYCFLVLAVSVRSPWAQGFFLACAINTKQYLGVLLGYALIKGNYRLLVVGALAGLALLGGAALYVPARDYFGWLENMFLFLDDENVGNFWRLPYSASVDGFVTFARTLNAQYFFDALSEVQPVLRKDLAVWYASALEAVVIVLVAVVVYGLVRYRDRLSESMVAFAILVCLFNLSDAAGSYALIFLVAYLPAALTELSRKELLALFALFQPADAMMLELGVFPNAVSYLSGETVSSVLGFTFGSFIRPAAMLALLFLLALRLAGRGAAGSNRSAQGSASAPAAG